MNDNLKIQKLFKPFALLVFFIVFGYWITSCRDTTYPRPRGFHRLELPPHLYQTFDCTNCPFTFEYPIYGTLDTARIDSCFLNIRFKDFDCVWHITSRELKRGKVDYYYALEDYRQVIYHHSNKGAVQSKTIKTPYGKGIWYELYGEVPTSADFFFSDTSNYVLINSFYFNTALKNDSLAPIIDYMKVDLQHMIETIRWKKQKN